MEEESDYINRLQKTKDIIKLSSIALILIVWSIVSFIAYQNKKLQEEIIDNQFIQTERFPAPTIKQTPSGNRTNWEAEVNSEYGFTISYPHNFIFVRQPWVIDYPQEFTIYESKYLGQDNHYPRITITFILSDMNPDEYAAAYGTTKSIFEDTQDLSYYNVTNGKNILLDEHDAYQFEATKGNEGGLITLIKKGNDYLIEIANRITGMGEISNNLYYQILSTFKFID